jgi:uncharacterized protein YbaR (Trm112 family)
LRCPVCRGELDDAGPPPAVACPTCGVKYPVRDGIVHLLASEGKPL